MDLSKQFKLGQEIPIVVIHENAGYLNGTAYMKGCSEVLERIMKGEKLEGVILEGKVSSFCIDRKTMKIRITRVHYLHPLPKTVQQRQYIEGEEDEFHKFWVYLGKYAFDKFPQLFNAKFNPSRRHRSSCG